jgi:hypothetical protein
MAAQGLPIGPGTGAMLPYLTIGGFLMLGWRLRHEHSRMAGLAFANAGAMLAASLMARNRRGSRGGARDATTAAGPRYERGRTIYRNTPMADVGFDTQGIP